MNGYVKEFLRRGMMFGGFGPVVMGIVYLILQCTVEDFSLMGDEVFLGIFSTYLLAFVHAGSSVFHQIEHWSIARSLLFQLTCLYLAYTSCYLINSWLPFSPAVLAIFTGAFVMGYFMIVLIVALCVKATGKRLNQQLRR